MKASGVMPELTVTKAAKKQIIAILTSKNTAGTDKSPEKGNLDCRGENYVRLEILGGGCSSFKYDFSITDVKEKNDWCLEEDGAKLLVDQESLELIKGSTIDYQVDLIGAAFKITNPNTASSCGCGMSFSI